MGEEAPKLDIARVCEAMGAKVETADPFDLEKTRATVNRLLEEKGTKVLILRQSCALSPEKKGKKRFDMRVDETRCVGDSCGCNRLCTRIFQVPRPGVGHGEEKVPHRRGDLRGLRRLRGRLHPRSHCSRAGERPGAIKK